MTEVEELQINHVDEPWTELALKMSKKLRRKLKN